MELISSMAMDTSVMERAKAVWKTYKPADGQCLYMPTMLACNKLSKETGLPAMLCMAYIKQAKAN